MSAIYSISSVEIVTPSGAASVVWALSAGQPPTYALWLGILLWMRDRHPPVLDERVPLGAGRALLALLAVAMLVVCFTWFPIKFVD